jgi:hypothetical protein
MDKTSMADTILLTKYHVSPTFPHFSWIWFGLKCAWLQVQGNKEKMKDLRVYSFLYVYLEATNSEKIELLDGIWLDL